LTKGTEGEALMKISNLRATENGDRHRIAADIVWEESTRPTMELYFETVQEFADGLSCNPHAFLVASAIAAMHHNEKRVLMDGEVCPELLDGLNTAMMWLKHWYGYRNKIPTIEAARKSNPEVLNTSRRAGMFISGGIDSLALLRYNRLNYPVSHPMSIKDGILVCGLELNDEKKFDYVKEKLRSIADDANISLIPIYTNVRYLDDDWSFWDSAFEGACFASIAHALSNRILSISIASTHNIQYSHPHGSHPMLDENYGSYDLKIKHELLTLSRFDRTKLLAEWDAAIHNLRVCNRTKLYTSDTLNCGRCEKCVRTMLSLLVLGVLEKSRSFPDNNVSAEVISSLPLLNDTTYPFYPELIDLLEKAGRDDLAKAVKQHIIKSKIYSKPIRLWRASREYVRAIDNNYLNNTIKNCKQFLNGIIHA
jgi:hypothetical protein